MSQTAMNFSCFMIDITLTDVGTEHIADIAAVVFEYIGMKTHSKVAIDFIRHAVCRVID